MRPPSRLVAVIIAGLLAAFPLGSTAVPAAQAATKVPSAFVIRGSGAGHGVGMSQYGAYQLARTGSTAEEILASYYPGTSVGTATYNPRAIKVQVLGSADKRTKASLTVKSGRFTITDGTTHLGSFKAGKATLRVKGGKVGATIGKKTVSAARLVVTTAGVATVTGAQGSYHAGNLQVTVIGKRLNVVNQVAMNTDYLYGLDEMPASWAGNGGTEALRAQVIAARTYVINQILTHLPEAQRPENAGRPECDCHVFDDERSQNYTGWKKAGRRDNRPWIEAVDATVQGDRVQVVWAGAGVLAETVYFASTGSATGAGTGSNADVFGTPALSYLAGVDDPYSARAPGNPYRSWKRTLSQAKAAKVFGLKRVVSISLTGTYPGGLVKSLTATASDGRTSTLTLTTTAWTNLLGVRAPWLTSVKPA